MNNHYLRWCGTLMTLLFLHSVGFSQSAITGKLTDAHGVALQSVTILVKETNVLAQTDVRGMYSIVAKEGQTLRFSLIGYTNRELTLGQSDIVNVTLTAGENELEEVIVTGMGIKREKKSLGYAATSISTEHLTDLGSPVNALTTMYGQVPGLRINATALGPSGGLNINIRNAVAFSESSNVRPLFVIDGIPMLDWQTDIDRNPGNGLNDLNLDDIASFEILRGAKASLLYGSQGANGVVLITSKTGKKRPGFGIDVNLSHQFDTPWVLQEFQNEFGSGFPVHWNSYGPNFSNDGFFTRDGQEAYAPVTFNFGPRFDGRDILYYDNQIRPYEAQPNNVRDLYRNGYTSVANISIQGGGDLGGFRLAYTNKQYQGIFEGFTLKDNNMTFNGNMNITDRVKLQLVSTYSQTVNINSPAPNQNAMVTFGMPRNLDVMQLRNEILDPATGYSYWRMEDRNSIMNPGGVIWGDLAERYFFAQSQDRYANTRNHFRNSLTLDIKLTDALSINSIGGFDWIINDNDVNQVLRAPLSILQGGGLNEMSTSQNVRWNAQTMLRYERPLNNPDLHFSGFVGYVYQSVSDRMISRTTNGGFLVNNWASLNNSFNPLQLSRSLLGNDELHAVFGSAQLSYKDYLFVDFQARNDWSSILPPDNNSYFYPGTSVSWVFSEFMDTKPSWLSLGKVRASWADVGRPGPRYFANEIYNIEVFVPGIAGISAPALIPPLSLRPERKREFEVGFDSYFLDNRLGFEASYFVANTYNQIMPLSIAPSSGYTSVGVNAGQVQTRGYEFMINSFPIRKENFSWNLILNGSASTPRVRQLDLGITSQNLWGAQGARVVAEVGQPYGQIRVSPYTRDVSGNLVVNANGLYFPDGSQEKVVGKVIPDFVGGVVSNFQYKGLVLGINIDSQFGSTLISQTNMYMRGNGSSKESLFGRDEATGGLPYYVTTAGQRVLLESHNSAVPSNSRYDMIFSDGIILPGVKQDGTPNDIITSAADRYGYFWRSFLDVQEDVVYKNDYIKLRNITLSYALPKSFTSRIKFERLVVTGFVNNVAFLYRTMPNVDPESFNGTNVFFENNAFPTTRSYGMSVRAAF